jgi:hypothetical protein
VLEILQEQLHVTLRSTDAPRVAHLDTRLDVLVRSGRATSRSAGQ